MLANKKEFFSGVGLMVAFLVVLVIMFSPVFGGQNGLNYLDGLYNSISKGSAYYIPDLKIKAAKQSGNAITASVVMKDEKQAMETAPLFLKSGAMVNITGSEIKVSGDLGSILTNCLEDSDQMFNNRGEVVKDKYKMDERLSMYNWWMALKALTKDLNKQKKFTETKFIGDINKRAVECSYNYYKVTPENISAKWGLVVFSLVFYVVYTMWYGFAILFMFEGWGLKLEH
jgi:hypothetical protein